MAALGGGGMGIGGKCAGVGLACGMVGGGGPGGGLGGAVMSTRQRQEPVGSLWPYRIGVPFLSCTVSALLVNGAVQSASHS